VFCICLVWSDYVKEQSPWIKPIESPVVHSDRTVTFNFKALGAKINENIFPNERFKSSLFDIPGQTQAIYAAQNVVHGEVTYCYYKSKTINTIRPLVIYTPPGFEVNGKTKYPVLYLIHGGSDTEETWTKVGYTNLIADNLIAQGKAKPMIIVMPYANVRPKPMGDFTDELQAVSYQDVTAVI
jgi:enterochelin esterase family protein